MSQSTPKPGDQDLTTSQWEQEASRPLVADGGRNKTGLVVIGVTAVAAGVIGFGLWLKHSRPAQAAPNQRSEINVADPLKLSPMPAQAAASAPARPASAASAPAPTPASVGGGTDPLAAQRAQMEMQRRLKEEQLAEARLKSKIIDGNPGAAAGMPTALQPGQGPATPGMPGGGAGANGGERGAQDANSRFARAVSGAEVPLSVAGKVENLEFKILQGKWIDALLVPRAVSDLPGTICAQTDRDVYGEQGRRVLIPWGARVCGTYSAELRKGQTRLFTVWNRLTWSDGSSPDGFKVVLDSIGGDQLGTAGMGGYVDRHFAEIFGASAMISIVGAGAANADVGNQDQYNSAAQYRSAVQQAAAQTAQQQLQPYINIPPTVTVPFGSPVRILVNRDLDFTELHKQQAEAAQRQSGNGITVIQ